MALIVNGERIEDSTIKQEVERLRPDYEKAFVDMPTQEREAQLLDWSKENIIERVLLKQEFENTEPKIPKEQIESVIARLKKQYKDQQEFYKEYDIENDEDVKKHIELIIKMNLKFEEFRKDLNKPSQAAIIEYYQKNKEQFATADEVRVAHIIKHVDWQSDETTAYTVIKQAQHELKKGTPFEFVVDKYSDYTDHGGDLGYVTRGQLAEEFEDIVFNLDIGQVSDIFRTRFGFHIAKVYDIKPAEVPTFEQAKPQIISVLKEQMQEKAIDDFIDHLRGKAKIEEI